MNKNKERLKKFAKAAPFIIAIASAIAALTPNDTDDIVVDNLKRVVNIFALNIMHAGQTTQ